MKAGLGFYIKNQEELVKKYDGHYIIIVNQEVIGNYASMDEALQDAAKKKLRAGHYSIQPVGKGEETYTVVLSRTASYA